MNFYAKCPHCGANLSVPEEFKNDKQLHCSLCNQNFDNTSTKRIIPKAKGKYRAQGNTYPQKSKSSDSYAYIVIFLLICVVAIVSAVNGCDDTSLSSPRIGDRVVVVTNTWGSIDDDASDELGRAMVAEDHIGLYTLTQSGKVRHIWKGSCGKMIRGGWSQVQIRFDDGTLYWIPNGTVKKE